MAGRPTPRSGRRARPSAAVVAAALATLPLGACVVAQPYPVVYGYGPVVAGPGVGGGTAAGAAVGAAAGGLLGAAASPPWDRGGGALGGAAAGALVGGLIGNSVDQQNAAAAQAAQGYRYAPPLGGGHYGYSAPAAPYGYAPLPAPQPYGYATPDAYDE